MIKSSCVKWLCVLTLIVVCLIQTNVTLADSVQSEKTSPSVNVESRFWIPLIDKEIEETIQLNKNDAIVLEQLMMRAVLQHKTRTYLKAVKAASDTDRKNSILLANYGWILAKSRFNYTTQGKAIPEDLDRIYSFDEQSICDILQSARDIDHNNWSAYIGESAIPSGASVGKPIKIVDLTKHAFEIESNAVTLTNYGSALAWQGTLMRDIKQQKEGIRLLEQACHDYPMYYRVNLDLYFAYRYPEVRDDAKSQTAKQRFLASIPTESKTLPWLQEYLKYLGIS